MNKYLIGVIAIFMVVASLVVLENLSGHYWVPALNEWPSRFAQSISYTLSENKGDGIEEPPLDRGVTQSTTQGLNLASGNINVDITDEGDYDFAVSGSGGGRSARLARNTQTYNIETTKTRCNGRTLLLGTHLSGTSVDDDKECPTILAKMTSYETNTRLSVSGILGFSAKGNGVIGWSNSEENGVGVLGVANGFMGMGLKGQSASPYGKAVVAENVDGGYGYYQKGNNAKNYFQGALGVGVNPKNSDVKIEVGGGLNLQPQGELPKCDSTNRGSFFVVAGKEGEKDSVQACLKDAEEEYSWVTIY